MLQIDEAETLFFLYYISKILFQKLYLTYVRKT